MLAGFSNHDPGLVGFRELHPEHHGNHMIRVIYKTFNSQFKPILVLFLISTTLNCPDLIGRLLFLHTDRFW